MKERRREERRDRRRKDAGVRQESPITVAVPHEADEPPLQILTPPESHQDENVTHRRFKLPSPEALIAPLIPLGFVTLFGFLGRSELIEASRVCTEEGTAFQQDSWAKMFSDYTQTGIIPTPKEYELSFACSRFRLREGDEITVYDSVTSFFRDDLDTRYVTGENHSRSLTE